MPNAYLTIDDGPSADFRSFIDFLRDRNTPAVFFNRGDCMAARPDDVIYGIKAGFIMGNHTWSHPRASQRTLAEMQDEIRRTDDCLEDLYRRANIKRPRKYFRFPYMDRGMGACLSEPETLSPKHRMAQVDLLGAGLGYAPHHPSKNEIGHKRALQSYLAALGYEALPARGVTIPWYAETEMARGIDSLCTYSTSDWVLRPKHQGRYGFKDVGDLKDKIDRDPWLHDPQSAHIVLAHDQDGLFKDTAALIDYLLQKGLRFLDFASDF